MLTEGGRSPINHDCDVTLSVHCRCVSTVGSTPVLVLLLVNTSLCMV